MAKRKVSKVATSLCPFCSSCDYHCTDVESESCANNMNSVTSQELVKTWIKFFTPRTTKWCKDSLARLRSKVSPFETRQENNAKIEALKTILLIR